MTTEQSVATAVPALDDLAFERVVEPLLHQGYDLAFAVLRDRAAAEDAVQEAAVRACGWFLKIVLNQCRATMRSRWWRSQVVSDRVDGPVVAHDAGADLRVDLERALRVLSRNQRAVLFLDLVRLSSGRVLTHLTYGDAPAPVAPVLSADARYLAENDPTRPIASIRDLVTGLPSGPGRLALAPDRLVRGRSRRAAGLPSRRR